MKRFILGFITGLACAITLAVSAAKIVGSDGYMIGWDVNIDGETACSDPWISPSTQEIECED